MAAYSSDGVLYRIRDVSLKKGEVSGLESGWALQRLILELWNN